MGKNYEKILDKFESRDEENKFQLLLVSALTDEREIYDAESNELRAWPTAFSNYPNCVGATLSNRNPELIEKMNQYDIVLWENTYDRIRTVSKIVYQCPNTIVVGMVEGSLESPTTMETSLQFWFWDSLQKFDAFGYLVEKADSYYKLFTDKSFFLGVPYPCEWADEQSRQRYEPSEGDPIIIELGASLNHYKNGITSILVAKKLKEKYGDKIRVIIPVGQEMNRLVKEMFSPYSFEPSFIGNWQEWFLNREATIVLHMDQRITWGRYSCDAAAVKIPCLSTHGYCQEIFYPELVVDPFDIDTVIEKMSMLIENSDERERLGNEAYNKLSQLNYENSINRFMSSLKQVLVGE